MSNKSKKVQGELEQLESLTVDMAMVASAIIVLQKVTNQTEKFFDTGIDNDSEMSINDIVTKLESMGNNLMLSQCDVENSIAFMR